jgi:hypothetical protein
MTEKAAEKAGKGVTATVSLNLKDLEVLDSVEQGEWLHMRDAAGQLIPLELLVAGEDSTHVKAAKNKLSQRLNVLQRRSGRRKLSYDDAVEGDIILASGATLDWRVKADDGSYEKDVHWGDEVLTFSKTNIKALFTEFPFFVEQVLDFMEDRTNFMKS